MNYFENDKVLIAFDKVVGVVKVSKREIRVYTVNQSHWSLFDKNVKKFFDAYQAWLDPHSKTELQEMLTVCDKARLFCSMRLDQYYNELKDALKRLNAIRERINR